MIKEFKAGKWYRYTGRVAPKAWFLTPEQNVVLDGFPRKCINASGVYADFKGLSHPLSMWCWEAGLVYWEEVDESAINLMTCRVCGYSGDFETENYISNVYPETTYTGGFDDYGNGHGTECLRGVELVTKKLHVCPECRIAYKLKEE
jgi:hypothetical protein